MRAGHQEFFEVALVHESMGTTPAVVDGTAFAGRRYGRSVIVFSTEGDGTAARRRRHAGLRPGAGRQRAALGARRAHRGWGR